MEAVTVLLELIRSRTSQGRRLYVAWVDLRTAFPSLHRALLLKKLLSCGFGLGICRMVLSMFDLTASAVCLGCLVGHRFAETLGVREGAVESPHFFNAYISDIRSRLEARHPHLCRLLHIIIPILLYADDAALPADSAADLQLSMQIFEEFCNDHHLYIATNKTYITVFHAPGDTGVTYCDQKVLVDGAPVQVQVYGEDLQAAQEFKYLGVTLTSGGGASAHVRTRAAAFQRAIAMLLSGLLKLPACSHSFMCFLWQSLVVPVACYGLELFTWSDAELGLFQTHQTWAWRRLLQVGGRAPVDNLSPFLRLDGYIVEFRARRVAHLLRLINSPADSWQHVALLSMFWAGSAWLTDAFADLRTVLPTATIWVATGSDGLPFLVSNGHWSDEGAWRSAQAFSLPRDMLGRRHRTPIREGIAQDEVQDVRMHVRTLTREFKAALRAQHEADLLGRILTRGQVDPFSKSVLLSARLLAPGPPLHVALGWVSSRRHRSAIATLFSGDWFLGRYAGNFFARSFLPHPERDRAALTAARVDEASRVCISCWHFRREAFLENEAHVCMQCPQYAALRDELRRALTGNLSQRLFGMNSDHDKLMALLGSQSPADWEALGSFLGRVRQARRKVRAQFEVMETKLDRCSFVSKRLAWRHRGLFVCRHGAFFAAAQGRTCPCLSPEAADHTVWRHARLMPMLDHGLRKLIAVPFDLGSYERLGVLQARLRALGW